MLNLVSSQFLIAAGICLWVQCNLKWEKPFCPPSLNLSASIPQVMLGVHPAGDAEHQPTGKSNCKTLSVDSLLVDSPLPPGEQSARSIPDLVRLE